jgi:hypothetical protein
MKKKQNNGTNFENEEAVVEASQEVEQPAPDEEPIDEGAEINRLLDEGYSVKQIVALGFKRRTAYHYAKLRTRPENPPAGDDGTATTSTPVAASKHELIKLGSKDTIPPEAIVDALIFPRDGATIAVWKDGYASCLWQVIGIARLLQVLSAGQADVVSTQLQLWREAKEGSRDLAQEAAHQAALEVAQHIEQRLPREKATSGEPTIAERMLGPMADMAGKQLASIFERMFGMGMPGQPGQGTYSVPSGWEYQDEGGQSND